MSLERVSDFGVQEVGEKDLINIEGGVFGVVIAGFALSYVVAYYYGYNEGVKDR